jgi:hypothetical protein
MALARLSAIVLQLMIGVMASEKVCIPTSEIGQYFGINGYEVKKRIVRMFKKPLYFSAILEEES